MKIIISKINTDKDIEKTYNIMKQLRYNIEPEKYVYYIKQMISHQKQYNLISAYLNDKCLGVIGFSYDFRLSVGKMIYIEDLIIDENYRNLGIGKKLMDYVEEIAKKQNIKTLILDSAIHRKQAHKFYERLGFINTSNNYKKFLNLNNI